MKKIKEILQMEEKIILEPEFQKYIQTLLSDSCLALQVDHDYYAVMSVIVKNINKDIGEESANKLILFLLLNSLQMIDTTIKISTNPQEQDYIRMSLDHIANKTLME